jgi:hypothetical protein
MTIVGGLEIGWSPRTQDSKTNERKQRRDGGQGIPESLHSPQKLRIPLHVSSSPLLQGDEGTFTFRVYPRI